MPALIPVSPAAYNAGRHAVQTEDLPRVKFRPENLKQAVTRFLNEMESREGLRQHLTVVKGDTTWNLADNAEEFYPDYSDPEVEHARYNTWLSPNEFIVRYSRAAGTEVTIALPRRAQVERVFETVNKRENR
jgi:hypothetical protein